MEERGVSQSDIASASGLSQPYVSQVLAGRRKPTVDTLQRMMKAVGLSLTTARSESRPKQQGEHYE